MPKFISALFVVLTLLSLTSQATGQQVLPRHQQRHDHTRDMPSNNNLYQVWAGIDVMRYWTPQEADANPLAPFPRQHEQADIAGVWDTVEMPGLVLTLLLNGNFSLATAANPEQRCAAGVERGTWALQEQTNQLFFQIKTDTNGRCGFSDRSTPLTIQKTATGLTAFTSDQAATAGREVPLVRR